MPDEKLMEFIESKLKMGIEIQDIKTVVLQNGWKINDFDEAILAIAKKYEAEFFTKRT